MTQRSDATEWNAAVYHRVSDPHITWGARAISRLAVRGDELALDCGCGTGRLTAELLERLPNGHVIAIDRSQNMLDAAREYLTPRFGDRVSYRKIDLQLLDRESLGTDVDLVFSTATFHWLPDHPALFRALFGVLRPGGWLVAQCGGGENLARLVERANALQRETRFESFFFGWNGPWEFADDKITDERLSAAGFAQIETNLEFMPVTMESAGAYREFLANVIFGAHLARIPDQQLCDEYLDRLVDASRGDDPPFVLDYWRLNMRGQRP